ncbi:MAG: methylated-DNA--[protein]-cysteine S-methyltransferase [Ignavibacteriaceae bacterium]|jgi:O-6-methylguanine DNA methyltransferase|nr:methylated-DNA--[protein]-cysteine S-methyltransferase [Ignavibacteriaceae bacterium]
MKQSDQKIFYTPLKIGGYSITVFASTKGICHLDLNSKSGSKLFQKKSKLPPNDKIFFGLPEQLKKYFDSELKAFKVPLDIQGTTFQLQVWNELMNIPFGEVVTYKDIALRIKNEKSFRAVGNAVGANPVPIVIPCHRVIKTSGALGGFSGGGPKVKEKLLELEGCVSLELF